MFTYWQDRIDICTGVISLAVYWMFARIAWKLSTGIIKEMEAGAWFSAAFFGLTGLITLIRGTAAIFQHVEMSPLESNWINISTFIAAIILSAASTFSALMLTSTRLEMKLKSAQDQMELFANTDLLTGLYNCRHFIESAQREFFRARRFNHTASVLFADLDRFKKINDTYGHLAGDAVLNRVGKIITSHVR